MMFVQTCLWLLAFHAVKFQGSWAVMLMDSEQNYIPPPASTTMASENAPPQTHTNKKVTNLDTTCPILYPRYPHIFGLTQSPQSFHFQCKKRSMGEQINFQNEAKSCTEHR